jgi:hypothetical protein
LNNAFLFDANPLLTLENKNQTPAATKRYRLIFSPKEYTPKSCNNPTKTKTKLIIKELLGI